MKIETKACKINPLNVKLANSPSPPLLVNCPLYTGFSVFLFLPLNISEFDLFFLAMKYFRFEFILFFCENCNSSSKNVTPCQAEPF